MRVELRTTSLGVIEISPRHQVDLRDARRRRDLSQTTGPGRHEPLIWCVAHDGLIHGSPPTPGGPGEPPSVLGAAWITR